MTKATREIKKHRVKKTSRCYTCKREKCAWRYKPETWKQECTPSS